MNRIVYNEFDPFAAAWLRTLIRDGLIPGGDVDERSIHALAADDLGGGVSVHLFGGVGGWPLALRLAGWPDDRPVWTGSCPCQPYSSAGKGKGDEDPRNLWPEMFRLVRQCRPDTVFGEQVENAVGHGWLDRVFADLEGEGYACGAAVLGAHSVGAPHIRQRLFWVADAQERGRAPGWDRGQGQRRADAPRGLRDAVGLADALGERVRGGGHGADGGAAAGVQGADGERERVRPDPGSGRGVAGGLGHPEHPGPQGGDRPGAVGAGRPGPAPESSESDDSGAGGMAHADGGQPRDGDLQPGREHGLVPQDGGPDFWADYALIPCRDGKWRRTQPGLQPLAHGIPVRRSDPRLGYLLARLGELGHSPKAARRILKDARRNRVGRLRGMGNSVNPWVTALFVRAFMEATA